MFQKDIVYSSVLQRELSVQLILSKEGVGMGESIGGGSMALSGILSGGHCNTDKIQ